MRSRVIQHRSGDHNELWCGFPPLNACNEPDLQAEIMALRQMGMSFGLTQMHPHEHLSVRDKMQTRSSSMQGGGCSKSHQWRAVT